MINNKCKGCECCSKNTVTRIDRKGNKVQYTYCDGGKAVHEKSNWLLIKGGYLRSTNYIYNPIILTHSRQILSERLEALRQEGLFPLPDRDYSKKYQWFRRMTNTSLGRTILLNTLPLLKKEK